MGFLMAGRSLAWSLQDLEITVVCVTVMMLILTRETFSFRKFIAQSDLMATLTRCWRQQSNKATTKQSFTNIDPSEIKLNSVASCELRLSMKCELSAAYSLWLPLVCIYFLCVWHCSFTFWSAQAQQKDRKTKPRNGKTSNQFHLVAKLN